MQRLRVLQTQSRVKLILLWTNHSCCSLHPCNISVEVHVSPTDPFVSMQKHKLAFAKTARSPQISHLFSNTSTTVPDIQQLLALTPASQAVLLSPAFKRINKNQTSYINLHILYIRTRSRRRKQFTTACEFKYYVYDTASGLCRAKFDSVLSSLAAAVYHRDITTRQVCDNSGSYSATSCRNALVKKWLQMFPALYTSSPPGPRSSAVSGGISLYSTTWAIPCTLQTTPTGSAG